MYIIIFIVVVIRKNQLNLLTFISECQMVSATNFWKDCSIYSNYMNNNEKKNSKILGKLEHVTRQDIDVSYPNTSCTLHVN